MKLLLFTSFLATCCICFCQPEYTRKEKIKLQTDDSSLPLHCRVGNYIISFNPVDLSDGYSQEKQHSLYSFLNRKDTLSLDSMIEHASELVRDSALNFCNTRFSKMVYRNFLIGNVAIKNIADNSMVKKIYALIDDRMGWIFITYYYFTDTKKATVFYQFNDVSFCCPAF